MRHRSRLAAIILGAWLFGVASAGRAAPADGWLSLDGTSGLVFTPTADILPDASVRFGYVLVDRAWARRRGEFDNELYFISFGFLPRVELTVRATVWPGSRLTRFDDAPIVDRMGSARLQILRGGPWPGLAVGVSDVRGTRLYHALYAVATEGVTLDIVRLDLRGSVGFGSRALEPEPYLLDGVFGGIEARFLGLASIIVDFDTEKWNSGVRLQLFRRVSVSVAWLNLETPSGGAAWTHRF